MKNRTDYDAYMDRLAKRINDAIPAATEIPDVISVCAAIIGCALADVPVDSREKVLTTAFEFARKCCAKKVADNWCHPDIEAPR